MSSFSLNSFGNTSSRFSKNPVASTTKSEEKSIEKKGSITIAQVEGMQENLSQDKDVTSIIEYLEEDVLNFENIR